MSKKQVMKEIFSEKINQDSIYQRVLSKAKEECTMKEVRGKKIIYALSSSVAVFILGFGIIIGTNTFNNNKESSKTELNIYKIASLASSDMDVKYDNYNQKMPLAIWEKISEEFKVTNGISYENFTNKIPEKFEYLNFYTISLRGYKDANLPNEWSKHDYVFEYRTKNDGKILIVLCKEEKSLRDYKFEFKGKKSQIGHIKLEISQYNNKYMATFKFNNVNYDIETTGITENELLELLQSILVKKE